MRRLALAAALLTLSTGLTACGNDDVASPAVDAHQGHPTASNAVEQPLRAGEERLTIAMPEAYTPSAPTGIGTDDYRCFLLDPGLDHNAFITGTDVKPGNQTVVHHVILFRVPPKYVAEAEQLDATTNGEGWTCFGNSGIADNQQIDNAPWLGAWAPGGSESVLADGLGVPLEKGSRIVMQVHYNLLAGREPDTSAAQLRIMPASAHLQPLQTMLLPAPVELPCRPGHTANPLCDREKALADVQSRFGVGPGSMADILHFLCGPIKASGTQTCDIPIREATTVRAVAGHMHLLGRSISITANPGTDREQVLLDIPVWNFDNQGAKPIDPVDLKPGDTVRVTCHHVQWLRDKLPSFEGQPDRYVIWGEGTTDEMCLGILQVTHP
jgi:hypothetical protein